jgi:hypothetical protein
MPNLHWNLHLSRRFDTRGQGPSGGGIFAKFWPEQSKLKSVSRFMNDVVKPALLPVTSILLANETRNICLNG